MVSSEREPIQGAGGPFQGAGGAHRRNAQRYAMLGAVAGVVAVCAVAVITTRATTNLVDTHASTKQK